MPRSTNRHRLGDKSTTNVGSDPITWWRCGKCGAQRIDHQIGLERTPGAYIEKLVGVFREVHRVLCDAGTLWIIAGDSFASAVSGGFDRERRGTLSGGVFRANKALDTTKCGFKAKDLTMMPARLALALQADGWFVRSDIIWHKPNPMPESVKDRPTNAYEHVFLLTKQARYYFDHSAIATPSVRPNDERGRGPGRKRIPADDGDQRPNGMRHAGIYPLANARNVWTIATEASKVPHYATMPVDSLNAASWPDRAPATPCSIRLAAPARRPSQR